MTVAERFIDPRLALDLGTGRTRLASLEAAILAEIPSSVEGDSGTLGSLALARRVQRPVEHGVVVDVEAAARMLAPWIRTARGRSPWKPSVLACHPSDASATERERLMAAVQLAGAGALRLVPEPIAVLSAENASDSSAERPRLVVDLGEGVTDIAVVQGARVLASAALRRGLGELRSDLRRRVLAEHGLPLLPREVESLLALEMPLEGWVPVSRAPRRGHRVSPDGKRVLSETTFVSGATIAGAIAMALEAIAARTTELLRALETRDARVVTSMPALLAGGGALLPHLCRGIGVRLGLGVKVALDPVHAVIRGARRLLRDSSADGWVTERDPAQVCPASR